MEYRTLEVDLTDEEVKQKGDILAARIAEHADVDQERKARALEYREQLAEIRGDIASLARQVRTRRDERVTACMWERDDARFSMILVRQDTGEIVETRPMRDDERQMVFPPVEGAPAAPVQAEE